MKKENKIHLEGAKVYGPQDYEVVDELKKLKEENKKLQEKVNTYSEEYGKLREEKRKLKAELGEYKKMFEDQLKEVYIKNTAEFLDKKFPKINGFMEEDTLQELRDLGEI